VQAASRKRQARSAASEPKPQSGTG
jgi:hypothetical protein